MIIKIQPFVNFNSQYTLFFISISKFQLRLGDAYFLGKISPIFPLALPLIVRVTITFRVAMVSFLTTIF